MVSWYAYTLFSLRADLRLLWEVTDGILPSLGESFSKAKKWIWKHFNMLLQHHAYTVYITSLLSGCILQHMQRHKLLKLSLWQARFPIIYRYLFPISFPRQKYMQYKQNIIDMKQWIFPHAGEMCNEKRFLGSQAHSSISRHWAEQATRGSASAVENATKRESEQPDPGSIWCW